ncbi:ATP-binding cassette domain-containing protein [Dermabacteraceae bacterium TAE3-ERU27]|nr:ATP-binding cassette domain-containing protein [Dermabacteraceae bacterium TAE3-ERU27]
MIVCDKVSKAYGEAVVVNEVELTIPAGGVTSVIGPNGAGKSTLLSLIARLKNLSGGSVSVDGMDVTKVASETLAKRLAILKQDNHLDIRLTVEDLVTFGRFPHCQGRPTTEDREYVERAIAYLDLGELRSRFLDELSGGQRQRAFVAMVLAQDTDYVLLDEPLNNLDMKHSVAMMRMVRRAAEELGKTIVVVIHDINFASFYSDRIVAMRDGKVVAQGTPEEIMTERVLEEIYSMRMHVTRSQQGKPVAMFFDAELL